MPTPTGWLEYRKVGSMQEVVETVADRLSQGVVVGWFQGKAEVGQRALGSRSLLADPRDAQMIPRLNKVKGREAFRPFAPSVLAEHASQWFDGLTPEGSPYMSLTVPAKTDARSKIPAVCHVDGTARLQTVKEEDNPWYYRLIQAFFKITGVPMVLNTSLNIRGEPIVESPSDAIRTFLATGSKGMPLLVLGQYLVSHRTYPPDHDPTFDASLAIPTKVPYYADEVRTHSESGLPSAVRIMVGQDVWVTLESYLELMVLEQVDGLTPLEEVVETVVEEADDEGVGVFEVMSVVKSLYEHRLLSFVVE